ncbi:hypothetical protein BVG16_13375 [Paenibacillus selenitireducens]|uniref:HTH cro/C1-type domain-containing protein n=1 Tax=Paenibacillus selenitireducens TaxID=1324314 RepID=A0A1T2XC17_9BACL|nr:hypothetical protein [Paenibacillus selenitireducens]OPA77444.1 hypothetical protein BVG16_13375 [Paenibacillus selenitireducens]
MKYHELLKLGIEKADLSLAQICRRMDKKGVTIDRAIVCKLKNGKIPPAKDNVNKVLAQILEIDESQLRIAAAKETIPEDLYNLIKVAG